MENKKLDIYSEFTFFESLIFTIFNSLVRSFLYPLFGSISNKLAIGKRVLTEFLEELGAELLQIKTSDGELLEAMYYDPEDIKLLHDNNFFGQWKEKLKKLQKLKYYRYALDYDAEDLFGMFKVQLPIIKHSYKKKSEIRAVVICHGQGGLCGISPQRIFTYLGRGLPVIEFSYRGYRNSTGDPTFKGTIIDAVSVTKWLMRRLSLEPNQVLVHGISLGSSVASYTSRELGTHCIIDRGFSRLSKVAENQLPGIVGSFIKNVKIINFITLIVRPIIRTLFDFMWTYSTQDVIPKILGRVLILRALQDPKIPYDHADQNFNALLTKYNNENDEKTAEHLREKYFADVPGGHSYDDKIDRGSDGVVKVWIEDISAQKKLSNFLYDNYLTEQEPFY
ncbi:hypothetical protein M0813_26641 [Anaeramoeba flamelloides]|uniref:AB hydrolase-1 domain-containing protein n=1 Tax=Anaeramoeba flamelloides TaxID=1746091 RepID=A0AAV7YJL6_9EUKA|nr:hypothetical protein M0812_25764 [Anaeramoeba flamelloides]KAJ6237848.1 hypothetical protein M0813_26641 [Anaeramoeba flamelloides]